MHELSIALSIIEVAEEELLRLKATDLISIRIRVGALSGVGKAHLRSAFEVAVGDTHLAKTQLIFEDVPVLADCPVCLEARPICSLQRFHCAVCDSPVSSVVQGRELQVIAMEVE